MLSSIGDSLSQALQLLRLHWFTNALNWHMKALGLPATFLKSFPKLVTSSQNVAADMPTSIDRKLVVHLLVLSLVYLVQVVEHTNQATRCTRQHSY